MSKKNKDWKPGYRPVERIELSDKHIPLRAFCVGLCILIAAVALGAGFNALLSTEPGWQTVEAEVDNPSYCGEFTFSYDFSDYGGSASAAYKQLVLVYSQAQEDAYTVFDVQVTELGTSCNSAVTVDPALYDALALLEKAELRYHYLAPVNVEYSRVFTAESDSEAEAYDPERNPQVMEYVRACAAFANDPDAVSLELLENYQVRLNVSGEYLAFIAENEIEGLVDLGWMRNAFVCDYLAQRLTENGFTCGSLTSYDGFMRNLDTRGTVYGYNIFDRLGNSLNKPAVWSYDAPCAVVFLRSYAMSDRDSLRYYEYSDGSFASAYLDTADGVNRTALDTVVSYSTVRSCAQILVELAPAYISDLWDIAALGEMEQQGIYTIWCEENTLFCNDESALLETDEAYSLKQGSTITN